MEEIDIMDLVKIIKEKNYKYFDKYNTLAKYIKMPYWLLEILKQKMVQLSTMKIDYETGNIKFLGLIICETMSITKIEEIEVF